LLIIPKYDGLDVNLQVIFNIFEDAI